MILSAIVAMSRDRVIGYDNNLIWKLKTDLRHFKVLTTGHTIIMGRKTFESIGKPLPDRVNVVLSRQDLNMPGVIVVKSIPQALRIARMNNDVNPFIIGGEEIYKLTLPYVNKVFTTEIDKSFIGDAFFPELPPSFELVRSSKLMEEDGLEFKFNIYERKPSNEING